MNKMDKISISSNIIRMLVTNPLATNDRDSAQAKYYDSIQGWIYFSKEF
jgi:hypothetical protein